MPNSIVTATADVVTIRLLRKYWLNGRGPVPAPTWPVQAAR